LERGQGIAKTKRHPPKSVSAKRGSECGRFLVFKGNINLGLAGIFIKKIIEGPFG